VETRAGTEGKQSRATTAPATEPRSVRKRRAILEAATEAFLERGYLGTSMDEIAAAASVSKQTVYKHFADKETLFTEIVTGTVNEAADPVHDEVASLAETGHLEADLVYLARRQLAAVLRPELMRLRRLVIGEVSRFPELGRAFYERGAGRTISTLAASFRRLAERGLLEIDDAELAATHFNWLVMSAPVNRAMLVGDDGIPSPEELDRYAEGGARAFLAAYGRDRSAS
jgi:TetR/AcrR family transcriptional regulator, mexJK operon transcriptional repressor